MSDPDYIAEARELVFIKRQQNVGIGRSVLLIEKLLQRIDELEAERAAREEKEKL